MGAAVPVEARSEGHTGTGNTVIIAEAEPTEGIISPDSQSPNNRATPDGEAVEPSDDMGTSEAAPTDGIISPESQSPNNRAIPDGDSAVEDAEFETEDPNLTDGIISPDSQSPNNREVPGETETDTSGQSSINEDGSFFDGVFDGIGESEPDVSDGIISPNDESPNNREVPDGDSAIEDAEYETQDPNLTDGIISPDSQSPNNRATSDGDDATEEGMTEPTDMDSTDGTISPNDESPNNRETSKG